MLRKMFKVILVNVIILSILLVLVNAKKKEDDLQQTCSKDDELCNNAEKAKETVKETAERTGEGKVEGKGAQPSADTSAKVESKSSKKSETKEKVKKVKTKKEEEIANCPLCSYTRPLIKHILDWVKDLLNDPMLIMVFNMFKDKIWELGHMTKELIGFRLF